jgi:hypothetical protein
MRVANNSGKYLAMVMAAHDREPIVFVQCIGCDAEAKERDPFRMTDAEAIKLFEARGWSVGPTLCPKCRAAGQDAGG